MDVSSEEARKPLEYILPLDAELRYETDDEYRQCIQDLISSCPPVVAELGTAISEYDDDDDDTHADAITLFLDFVYQETKEDPMFRNLYEAAAPQFFSEDPTIGLVVLFSYDYLSLFFAILHLNVVGESDWTVGSKLDVLYRQLLDKLSERNNTDP